MRERNVIGYLNDDGTTTVTGSALPVDQAAAACAHVEELARATKRAGHPGRIGPLRADLYLGLLDGRWQHCTRDQIIADLLTRAISDTDDADPDNSADSDQPTGPSARDDIPAGGEAGDARADSSSAEGASAGDTSPDRAPDGGDDDCAETCTDGEAAAGAGAAQPARRVGVELRVGLSTLLGRDGHPGEVAGWGPVPAEVARTVMIAQRAAEWRYALTDAAGQLLLAGITRRRPASIAPQGTAGELPPCRGGIVELHVPAALLTELAADLDACGEWVGVVTDIAAQYAQAGRRERTAQEPTARFAGMVLRRHVQIRDRSCVYPGCRATAGHFTWISPLGRIYRTQPPPIINDLPEPRPRPHDRRSRAIREVRFREVP